MNKEFKEAFKRYLATRTPEQIAAGRAKAEAFRKKCAELVMQYADGEIVVQDAI